MTNKRRTTIGINESRNFSSVKIEILDEEIEFSNEEEFTAKCRQIYDVLRSEIEIQFSIIEEGKKLRGDK